MRSNTEGQALGIVPNEKGGIQVISKKQSAANKPVSALTTVTIGGNKTNRKSVETMHPGTFRHAGGVLTFHSDRTYKAVANLIARNGYRPDLRHAAVARASAIRRSQRTPKPEPEKKLRGAAARRAAAAKE